MSQRHSKAGKREGAGRSGSFGQQRSFSGRDFSHQKPSRSPPTLKTDQTFKKPDDGLCGNAVSSNSESLLRIGQNIAHSSAHFNRSYVGSSSTNGKPEDTSNNQRNAKEIRKAREALPLPTLSSSAPFTQDKGSPVAFLQFGTINPEMVNGMQFPARTSSAPPNLDEQNHDQAPNDSSFALAKLPKPSAPKSPHKSNQPYREPRKEIKAVTESTKEAQLPMPAKKNFHEPISSSSSSNATTAPPSVTPVGRMPPHYPFQRPQIPLQFSSSNPQMLIPSIQSQPLQGLGFTPHLGQKMHQFGPIGIGIAPQFPHQQPGNFAGQRKTVRITHPDTHEEVKLDKMADSGQRPLQNVSFLPQSIPAFNSHHINYYSATYNASQMYYPPSSAHIIGAQAAMYSYPAGHNEHPISHRARIEQSKVSNLSTNISVVHIRKNDKIELEGVEVNQKQKSEFSGTISSIAIGKTLPTVSTQKLSTDSLLVKAGDTGKKEIVDGLESIMDHQERPNERSSKLSQQQQAKTGADDDDDNGTFQSTSNDCNRFSSAPSTVLSLTASTSSVCPLENSDRATDLVDVNCKKPSFKEECLKALSTSDQTATEIMAETPSSVLDGCMIGEFEQNHQSFTALLNKEDEVCNKDLLCTSARENFVSSNAVIKDGEGLISEKCSVSEVSVGFLQLEQSTKSEVDQFSGSLGVISVPKDKGEASIVRTNKEKKIKENLSKVDASDSSDLHNSHKTNEEKYDTPVEQVEQIKIHYGLEAVHESILKSRASDNSIVKRNQIDVGNELTGKKKYSRDLLLTFSDQCINLPEDFKIGSDAANILSCIFPNINCEVRFNPGRLFDQHSGVSRVEKCIDQHYGPMQSLVSQGGMARGQSDADKWQRGSSVQRGLVSSSQGHMQVLMHKTSSSYKVGKVSDEEEQKQRRLKAILNKLTPQNFEKLFFQVKEVNIDNAKTLSGVISQIFDKALMEPTFCEMYADFCLQLATELPDLFENNDKVTFRRLLLNKCQEEFERGEKEQAEAYKVEEESKVYQTEEEKEEKRIKARRRMLGNIRLIGELYKKKMLTERIMHECIKKLLGNYQNPDEEDIESLCKLMSTIGEMIDHFKAKEHMDAYFDMLTKLSANQKLSSRVRFMLKDTVDLRNNKWQQRRKVEGPKKIEDVHKDAAQERQAQERLTQACSRSIRGQVASSRWGPSADFAQRAAPLQNSLSYQANTRGIGSQSVWPMDKQLFETRIASVPLLQRPSNDGSITLGPQGGLAKVMSYRGQGQIPNAPFVQASPGPRSCSNHSAPSFDRMPCTLREDGPQKFMHNRLSGTSNDQIRFQNQKNSDPSCQTIGIYLDISTGERPVPSDAVLNECSEGNSLSEEVLKHKSILAIREFYSAKEEKELVNCIKDLNLPSFYPSMVSSWVTDSFERKPFERNLLAELLVSLSKSPHSLITQSQLINGFSTVLYCLEDAVNDAPKATEFLGHIFGKIIVENVVPLNKIGGLIRAVGNEDANLVELGLAAEVLLSILQFIKAEKGDSVLNEIFRGSNLQLEAFNPPIPTAKSKKLAAFL